MDRQQIKVTKKTTALQYENADTVMSTKICTQRVIFDNLHETNHFKCVKME